MFNVGEFVKSKVDASPISRGSVGLITENNHPKYKVSFRLSAGSNVEISLYDRELEAASQLVTNVNLNSWLMSETTEDERKARKLAGQCEECGTKLPISIWGLLPCETCNKEKV
jgi:hypothetical protein